MIFFSVILAYLAATSVIAYRAFAHDKKCAEANRGIPRDRAHAAQRVQRTPEADLLFYALIGGWIGAKIAQHRLRHKTCKQPFGMQLNAIGAVYGMTGASFAMVLAVLALIPTDNNFTYPITTAKAAAQVLQHAPGQLAISLRPPAGRPVGL
ncbi:DUF1294 domain-containing protein [Sulfitobacter sp. F26169L]|uniref:DUF1294 domain-containing protein n=1 Tax=Sulfitobacter sp. F26169L TaxID=2996015 RepID=UPI002260EAB5|nr:DUF1294 domain-containing protein [Sulfitobacter sp. F26169L]MCX7566568.1 DUF1294 domain-containing protein [Sulfitobacter sp. F26169L]